MRCLVLSIMVVTLVSGCASFVKSDYTKFDRLPSKIDGKPITFLPLDHQKGSAAWQSYADQISQHLSEHGFIRVSVDEKSDYIAVFDYGAGDTRTETTSMPIYGQTGGGTAFSSGTVSGPGGVSTFYGTTTTQPTYGITGYMPVTISKTDRFFTLRIIDANKSTPNDIHAVYEGKVTSTGKAESFEEVGSCIIETLMRDFRGSESDGAAISMSDC